jgi:hypothetical protein
MLSKDIKTLRSILSHVGKEVSEKALAKRSQQELDAAERWAVVYNAKSQEEMLGRRVPPVPAMPEWLFRI